MGGLTDRQITKFSQDLREWITFQVVVIPVTAAIIWKAFEVSV